ncbi:ras-related GTP-binding protein B isoform X12 [Tursiops truncatus]|uniref:Ras-related GTP-binding protein n=2 Tax=Tursiops truncatus TaxID=9739 RepID=A0A2U4A035_TURTR|nr:ras-related GTP-binding protein B isoform X6 [Tursiops truncatus]
MEESDSEKKMEKENLGTRMDPPIGEPEGSLGWVLPNTAMKKKVLLMGKSGSGKTSMRSIIFANYIARDTRRLGATIDVEHSHVRFLGNLVLNLWDCGGQDTFMENYFTSQRDNIFRNVEVLIYVFDVESRELEKDMHYYQSCLEAILQNSPDAKIFCLVHKMDLVQEDQRDLIFKEREEDLRRLSRPLECSCFRTSIWDETLYKAWSSIVYQLIPNVQQLEMNLRNFAEIIEADEVLLFERATFLVRTFCSADVLHTHLLLFSNGEYVATLRKNLFPSCHYFTMHSLICKVVLSASNLKEVRWCVDL